MSDSILYIWNIAVITFLDPCLVILISVTQLWVSSKWLLCLFIISHIFLLFCMPGNLWLDTRHGRFYLVVFWIFFYKYFWHLLGGVVKLVRSGLIPFWVLPLTFVRWGGGGLRLGQIIPHFWGKTLSALSTLLQSWDFSSLAYGNRHCPPWAYLLAQLVKNPPAMWETWV